MVEFPYRQKVDWILTYRSIFPCLSLLWDGQGAGHGSEKENLENLFAKRYSSAPQKNFQLRLHINYDSGKFT